MTTKTPATAENEKWLRSGFSQIFASESGSEGKTQNPSGVDSGYADPVLLRLDRSRILKFEKFRTLNQKFRNKSSVGV